jgi:hypothetical protein
LQQHAITIQKNLPSAIYTATQDSQVPEVSVKLVFPEQSTPERSQQRLIKVNYGTTFPTDKVMMVSSLRRMVSNSTFPQVGLGYQAKPFEQFHGAVDS